ncbi:MAG TPA: glycerophosphodiester phosphodiesterase family protein [Caulobacteraceae bacterium]|jgi:glycerophosphoryl diester phosphodiesterase|nr:glycerophosphodiester phosphodiesterase family protein [Caulobacteraceae bacterium]
MAKPIVIAHRGASGERPEHTRSAYELAIEQRCDYVEPDLVFSRDGVLVVRHENEIGATTDIRGRPEFADRRTIKTIEDARVEGWFTEDFTLAELKTLRCRERLPDLRPQNTRYDTLDEILTLEELVALARDAGRRRGRAVGLYIEMKHPSYFAALGFSMPSALAGVLRAHDLDRAEAAVIVECFDADAVKAMGALTDVRLGQLIGEADARLTPSGLRDLAQHAHAIGIEKSLVTGALCADAHAAGLQVHAWTYRPENAFLPPAYRFGKDPAEYGDLERELADALGKGVDGVFCDLPGVARRVVNRTF